MALYTVKTASSGDAVTQSFGTLFTLRTEQDKNTLVGELRRLIASRKQDFPERLDIYEVPSSREKQILVGYHLPTRSCEEARMHVLRHYLEPKLLEEQSAARMEAIELREAGTNLDKARKLEWRVHDIGQIAYAALKDAIVTALIEQRAMDQKEAGAAKA